MITCIVLAAGMSRRMGEANKMLLPFGNSTIFETTLFNISQADMGEVVVVVGFEAEKIKKIMDSEQWTMDNGQSAMDNGQSAMDNGQWTMDNGDSTIVHCPLYSVHCHENKDYEHGMTSSIKVGIHATEIRNPKSKIPFMICLSDMPLISPEEYQFLAAQFSAISKGDKQAIVVPFFKGEKGNPVIFSPFYKKALLHLSDTEGGKSILQQYKKHVYKIDMPTDSVLRDADTKEDYERLLKDNYT